MITRRAALPLLSVPTLARGQEESGSLLWNWFIPQLEAADARRMQALAQIRTPSGIAALRTRVRAQLLAAIGAFPQRTPLNARITGTLRREAYSIDKVIFESRPGFAVTANLYRPNRLTKPLPAVIESCGHYPEGKAAPEYQKVCAGLASHGIIAMVFDPIGQGERYMYRQLGLRAQPATYEHVLAGQPAYLTGRTLTHYRVWDAIRALDYLQSRPDVDGTRLGMVGHSGGGMTTLLTAPLESRLRAVMSTCAVTTFLHKTKALLTADPEQIVPGVYANGIDHPELIAAALPAAFLIGLTTGDYVPQEGTRRTLAEVQHLSANISLVETPGPHAMNQGLREACYAWMLKHLAGREAKVVEPQLAVESPADLQCTTDGAVMNLPGAQGLFELNREQARAVHAKRSRETPRSVRTAPPIDFPTRRTGLGTTHIIVVSASFRADFARSLVTPKSTVLELDIQGWEQQPGRKLNWEEFFAYRAFELGRPLIELRTQSLIHHATAHQGRVFVVGLEEAGIIALHAAANTPRIAGVITVNTLRSYLDVFDKPASKTQVSSYVPGALIRYDLPDLIERIRPRPVTQLETPDAARILEVCALA
ncbi:MAG: acetylxylan esterase [Acidobacteria bacterium]|nr:acetylxylan esterase [Acidobacteriota bacterium]